MLNVGKGEALRGPYEVLLSSQIVKAMYKSARSRFCKTAQNTFMMMSVRIGYLQRIYLSTFLRGIMFVCTAIINMLVHKLKILAS